MKRNLFAVDLFSGCGGFSYGFQQAGFHILIGVDNNEQALKTFEYNHFKSKILNLDLYEKEAINIIVKKIDKINIDVIIAGPPCQGFSLTGTRKENDKRNSLFNAVFDLARIIKPKALVIENVPGLKTLYNGKAFNEIYTLCEKMNYTCSDKVLYAPDFGVPQIRKRIFFVALRKDLGNFTFPDPVLNSESYVSCEDAISDLPSLENEVGTELADYLIEPKTAFQSLMRKSSNSLYNHVGTKHSEHVINVISQVPEGGNYKDLPPGVGDSRKFNEAWTRYHSKFPSKTIDTGHRNHFHYKWNRVPTVRENARLQTFPDDFKFLGSKTDQNRQVGNAVPPMLGKVIAEKLLEFI